MKSVRGCQAFFLQQDTFSKNIGSPKLTKHCILLLISKVLIFNFFIIGKNILINEIIYRKKYIAEETLHKLGYLLAIFVK